MTNSRSLSPECSFRSIVRNLVSTSLCFLLFSQLTLAYPGLLPRSNIQVISNSGPRSRLQDGNSTAATSFNSTTNSTTSQDLTQRTIYQTRFNFGVNFGSSFIREQYIYPSLFPSGATNELEAVTAAASANREQTRKVLEQHWMSYALDADWDWLQKNGVNAIRVPLGYWNIDGGTYTTGTSYEQFKDIYRNSWLIFKTYYIEPAAKRGISVLVDLHGLPGGANSNEHSGEQSLTAEFWTNQQYQQLALQALLFIASDLKNYDNINGIQVVNEAVFSEQGTSQKAYYAAALKVIREQDQSIPVIISDGWWANQWALWIQDTQAADAGFVVDHHVYRCFSLSDLSKTALQIISGLNGDMLGDLSNGGSGVDFMVGEWSSVLGQQTWANSGISLNSAQQATVEALFTTTQEKLIEARASAGSYFWTFKFESGNGGAWDFQQQIGTTLFAPKISVPGDLTLTKARQSALSATSSSQSAAFIAGFNTAWNEGLVYARQGSLIGRKQAVKSARKQEYSSLSGGVSLSDWGQGFDLGLTSLETAVRTD